MSALSAPPAPIPATPSPHNEKVCVLAGLDERALVISLYA
jgi:hypothetical protein